jgi:lysozyme family protein
MEIIRDKVIIPYMGGQLRWGDINKFSLEPARKAHNKEFVATTWIHYDVRQFELKYLKDEFFVSSLSTLNGKVITALAKELGFTNTCNCLGTTNIQKKEEEKEEVCYDCDLKFRKVAPIILEHEGGYVNDPDDSGGATNKGITIGTWSAYAKEDLGIEPTLENLKNITDEQAAKIYLKRYWEPKGFCKINDDKVGLMIYDWTITSGGAGKEVQKLLVNEFEQSIVIDGNIGINTINAINNVQNQEKLLNRIAEIRKQYYRNLAYDKKGTPTKNLKFLNGWLNRVDKCLNYNL